MYVDVLEAGSGEAHVLQVGSPVLRRVQHPVEQPFSGIDEEAQALHTLAVQEGLQAGFLHGIRLVSRPVCRRRAKKKCLSVIAERHCRDRQLFILC